ncbi:glycosyltransferase family 4 protein [Hyphomicrobium methylovorum]|uniref:glycosyltransferase family 4 protein n=1 Tax=Hyphomicrobium methylovorum TaxID=84 RepID=UPI0015E7001A|nr:glycosyltransferase family 1 protein [Hyphomicrobium methylovorum]
MKNLNVLVDLKPALDGHAGIPQESRLLFRALQDLGGDFRVDGLIQHQHETLQIYPDADAPLSLSDRIIRTSRTIASFDSEPVLGRLRSYQRRLARLQQMYRLRWQARRERDVPLGAFDAELFQDFVWSRLFSKSLDVQSKDVVTAARYKIVGPSRDMFHHVGLGGLSSFHPPQHLMLDTRGYDYVLAQTPFPARVLPGTQLIVRYHDAVPIFMPHTIGAKKIHQAIHLQALKLNVDRGALFACCSEATRADLLRIFPELETRSAVIHNIVSNAYQRQNSTRQQASNIIQERLSEAMLDAAAVVAGPTGPFMLMVSTIEPRKNHSCVLSAWERLRQEGFPDLSLVLVGARGWDDGDVFELMRRGMRRGQLFHLTNVPARELGVLYEHSSVTLCPSVGEGFDYSGVEAMQCGGLVVASDIPVHREIYGEGAGYFDPYSAEDLTSTLAHLLSDEGRDRRVSVQQAAQLIPERYEVSTILPQWRAFLTRNAAR